MKMEIDIPKEIYVRIAKLVDDNFPTVEEKASVLLEVGVNIAEEEAATIPP